MEKFITYNLILLSFVGIALQPFLNNNNMENMETTIADVKTKTITIKKGQSVDLLTGIQNPGTEEALQKYYAEVFPSAVKNGFKSEGAFLTIAPPIRGNFHASFLGVMTWTNEEGRENFLNEAAKFSYDYLLARRKIWSVFNLTQYANIDKDIEFTVSSDKIYVVSAFWVENVNDFRKNRNKNLSEREEAGGKILLDFGKGKSPNGFLYVPDIYSVEEWDSVESFEKFKRSVGSDGYEGMINENQWITKFMFPN